MSRRHTAVRESPENLSRLEHSPNEFLYETEIKLRVENPEQLRRRLKQLGFMVRHRRYFECNIIFDFKDSRLRRERKMLRLRSEDGVSVLTFKGAPRRSASFKIRREFETRLADPEAFRKALEGIGLRPVFEYQKHRTVYARKQDAESGVNALLLYDETPAGDFVELEGPKQWIDSVARELGYNRRDYITASYAEIYRKKKASGRGSRVQERTGRTRP